jgi:hypothetical protein
VSEPGPNAFGKQPDPERVDCHLGLPLPVEQDDDHGGVVGIAPAGCCPWLSPARPAACSMRYSPATPERQASELVLWPT